MTQYPYQIPEAVAGAVMLKSTPRLLEIIKAAHKRIGMSGLDRAAARHFALAKRRVQEAEMFSPRAKHPLLMPPYVKED